ncbi:MAG: (2Fe-2S)-binding protein [Elusimicrobia bacterium]|nr:MAG: (2Fe-2S)-binding protein [Elusimicrobiota bacterium]
MAEFVDELERFDASAPLAAGRTPPSSWYCDPAALALEKKTVLKRSWQAVGRLDQVKESGCYFSGTLAGEPFVVVRGDDGKIRGFFNVCRHHATCVVSGEGQKKRLTCPYHGWSYNLDGSLFGTANAGTLEDFKPADYGLISIPCEAWGPFVFLCLDPSPPSLKDQLKPLRGPLAKTNFEALHFAERRVYEMQCNWKVYVDNYLDGGYHVPTLHKELAGKLSLSGYRSEIFDRLSIQYCKGASMLDARVGDEQLYAWVYPNFMINRYGPVMDTNLVLPVSETRCKVVFDYYFENVEGEEARKFIAESIPPSDRVQNEDIAICESVQQGLLSSAYDQGRYAPQWEAPTQHFHKLLAADLKEGR